MDHKSGKIAEYIISLQHKDGTWGNEFHSLSIPTNKKPLTTEQALRRLKLLGFTIEDEPIKKTINCLISCLLGERKIDDYREKSRDWDLFTKLMLSAWVRIFDPKNEIAIENARYFAKQIEDDFKNGKYDKDTGEVDFVTFYEMNLLPGILDKESESRMLDYVISHKKGIYYIYDMPISEPPKDFASLTTSRYIEAIDILSSYESAKEKLSFVIDWLEENVDENGQWDLSSKAKDNRYFPLSDSWRNADIRKADCTEKISAVLKKLKS